MARCAVYQLADSVYRSSMTTLFHTFVDDCKAYNSGVDEFDTMQNSIPAMRAFLNSVATASLTLSDKSNVLASKPVIAKAMKGDDAMHGIDLRAVDTAAVLGMQTYAGRRRLLGKTAASN